MKCDVVIWWNTGPKLYISSDAINLHLSSGLSTICSMENLAKWWHDLHCTSWGKNYSNFSTFWGKNYSNFNTKAWSNWIHGSSGFCHHFRIHMNLNAMGHGIWLLQYLLGKSSWQNVEIFVQRATGITLSGTNIDP